MEREPGSFTAGKSLSRAELSWFLFCREFLAVLGKFLPISAISLESYVLWYSKVSMERDPGASTARGCRCGAQLHFLLKFLCPKECLCLLLCLLSGSGHGVHERTLFFEIFY